jgi:hypothetical protein
MQTGISPDPTEVRQDDSSRQMPWSLVLIIAAIYSLLSGPFLGWIKCNDTDVWWHLRTGEWILQDHAVPHVDSFSTFGMGKPWLEYSWLFDLIVWFLFQKLGMLGIVVYTSCMVVAFGAAVHRMVGRLQPNVWITVSLTVFSLFCCLSLFTARSWWFSILFFTLELDILMQARKTGKIRELLWLPVIFALWANLHIQFIDGLILLAIACIESIIGLREPVLIARLHPVKLGGVFAACALAALVNPYGWNIYKVAYSLATQSGVLTNVMEMTPLDFHRAMDWGMLVLVFLAVILLARARRFAPFETLLLSFSIFESIRAERDIWIAVLVAAAFIAAEISGQETTRYRLPSFALPVMILIVGCSAGLFFRVYRQDNAHLAESTAMTLPVHAVEAVKKNGWQGPLYNDYGWGGYLIWALRMPVSIDGRAGLHGDSQIQRNWDTWTGTPSWNQDPDLNKAGLVIGPVHAPLSQLLRLDRRFQLVYEDKLAVVFIARRTPQETAGKAGVMESQQ